jgi:hypothetical protein
MLVIPLGLPRAASLVPAIMIHAAQTLSSASMCEILRCSDRRCILPPRHSLYLPSLERLFAQ